jgi:hypothetical protein
LICEVEMELNNRPWGACDDSVMCTVQGCGAVAAYYLRYLDLPRYEMALAAYCEVHTEDAAKRLGCPWLIPERNGSRFPIERETRQRVRLKTNP